jgi:hypothetical protein
MSGAVSAAEAAWWSTPSDIWLIRDRGIEYHSIHRTNARRRRDPGGHVAGGDPQEAWARQIVA